jgi:hypothetical protein
MSVVETLLVRLPNLFSRYLADVSTQSKVQSGHHCFVSELTGMGHLDKALILDQGGNLLDADLNGDFNEMLVGHDESVRSKDSLNSQRKPRSVSEEDCLPEEGSGSSVAESANVKLFAHHVEINVVVEVAAHGATLMDLSVSESVDEAKHIVDVTSTVVVAEVDHVCVSNLYIACVSCVDQVGGRCERRTCQRQRQGEMMKEKTYREVARECALEVGRLCAEDALLRKELFATTVKADNNVRSDYIARVVDSRDALLSFR